MNEKKKGWKRPLTEEEVYYRKKKAARRKAAKANLVTHRQEVKASIPKTMEEFF